MPQYLIKRLEIHYGNDRKTVKQAFLEHEAQYFALKTTSDVNRFIRSLGDDGWELVSAYYDFSHSAEYFAFQKQILAP